MPEWIILLRCGALIGLKRNDEAEGEMRALIGRLKWNGYTPLDMGQGPWDAMPFGPGVVNPYDIARRIAAYYARTGREDQARALLQLAEEKRQAAARQIALGSSQPWAALRPAAASLQTHDPLAETLGLAVDQ